MFDSQIFQHFNTFTDQSHEKHTFEYQTRATYLVIEKTLKKQTNRRRKVEQLSFKNFNHIS